MDIPAQNPRYQFALFFSLISLADSSFALEDLFYVENWRPLITLTAAPTLSSVAQTQQTIALQSDITKTYVSSDNNTIFGRFEVFLGGQYRLSSSTLLQLGLASTFGQAAKLSGDIWEDANSDFDNYKYHYKVNSITLGIKGRILLQTINGFLPYLSARASFASNRSYDFSITPKIDQEIAAPAFAANTSKTFSYALGVGFERAYNEHINFGLGYEFSDWGTSQLGLAPGQSLNHGLAINNFYTHSLQFIVTYIC